MPGRIYSSNTYRYGFNGMEKDNEIKEDGNSLDFGARIFDNRLGRWLSIDPLSASYPYLAPYSFGGNSPILFMDKGGEDFFCFNASSQKTILRILRRTFGKDNGFSFNGNQLVHNGQNMHFTGNRKIILDYFIAKVVNNINMHYEFMGFDLTNFTWSADRKQYVVDEANATTPMGYAGQTLYAATGIGSNFGYAQAGYFQSKFFVFWHELGHPIGYLYFNANDQHQWAVGFENLVRKLFHKKLRDGSDHINPGVDNDPSHYKGPYPQNQVLKGLPNVPGTDYQWNSPLPDDYSSKPEGTSGSPLEPSKNDDWNFEPGPKQGADK